MLFFRCNELSVALPPLSSPPTLSLNDFLRLNNLSKCIPILEQNNVNTLDELRMLNSRELVVMGLDEIDARQILMQLTRNQKLNYDGIASDFDSFCVHRNEAMNKVFNSEFHQTSPHPSTLQMNRPSIKRSPLLSASSIATNQTNCSTNNSQTNERRRTLGEEGFFV